MSQDIVQSFVEVLPHELKLLDQIAAIHIAEISEGFLSTLGPIILSDMYRTISESKGSFVVACVNGDGMVLGFLAGSLGTHSLYREFLRLRNMRAKFRLALALLRPSRFWRIFETLQYSENKNQELELPSAEILNFCVDRRAHRKGLGGKLMDFAAERYFTAGVRKIRIVTGQSQLSAKAFYRKFGAQWVGDLEIHPGTPSTMFIWDLSDSQLASNRNVLREN